MKHNLGKIVSTFFLLSFIMLNAEDFTYTFNVDKPSPYVKEAVLLTLNLNQTNPDVVMLFNLDLVKSDAYTFQRLDIKETDNYHNTKVEYVYLIYPLKSGDINITFDLLQKVTTDESVAYSFSGDRDNVKTLVTVDTAVTLDPLQLRVRPLPPETLLVGDFTLTHSIPKHQAKAYEPLPFQVTIQGIGYPPLVRNLLPKEGNFTRFTEQAVVKSIASRQGTRNNVSYPMALSHSKSFTLSPLVIKAFNPQTQKSYTLGVPAQNFDISPIEKKELLDTIDSPKVWKADWSWLTTLMGYLIVFGAGYLTALSWKWRKKSLRGKTNPLADKIQNAKDEKALLQLLMATDSQDFNANIEKLETYLYGDGKINLKKVKQEILEQII